MIPSVVYYTAGKNKHTTMIGKFDYKTVADQSDKFMAGELPVFKPKVDKRDIIIEEKDCEAPAPAAAIDDGFDEILAEILAEEEAQKLKLEEEFEYKSKQKGKKKAD